jgi:hypothetical protein
MCFVLISWSRKVYYHVYFPCLLCAMYPSLDFLMSSAIVFHQENISTTNCALGHAMLLQCGLGLVIHTYWSWSCRFSLNFDSAPSRTFNSPLLCMCSVLFFTYTTSVVAWNSYVRLMHRLGSPLLRNCFAVFISNSSGWIYIPPVTCMILAM